MDESVYAELHCISNFTFLRGASHPEELVEGAARLGYSALALTDECSVGGVVRAHQSARDSGLKLIVGSEFRLEDGLRLVLLATNRESYGDLCELITHARRRASKGQYRLFRADLEQQSLEHCLALWLPEILPEHAHGQWIAERFSGRCWLAVELLGNADDGVRLGDLTRLADALSMPPVASGDVHMHRRSRRIVQDTLTAIRIGRPLSEAGQCLYANGERHLRSRAALASLYPQALLAESVVVSDLCHFSLDELRYEYPQELVPKGTTPSQWLHQLTEEGARRRWPEGPPASVRKQLEHELSLIAELRYEPYFLTVYDLVAFARRQGILCQGRGSAANSAVCYCLNITEVDPARMSMLFERFISKERNEPPDIDVDFEHQRREEVLQYVYCKYGRQRAALAATVITYRTRSALRDVAKALGLDTVESARLSDGVGWDHHLAMSEARLQELGFAAEAPLTRRLQVLVKELLGFPRHLSQHVGGMVISQGPLCRLVPIENAAMEARTVIQWDKDDLDALGLLKVDCLALGMLSAIHRALDLVNEFRGRCWHLADIPAEDPDVYEMIQRADTVGVFQIESRAQMAMLPRLKPGCFYDLVIEVAIVRPGPIQGGMVHPYLRRRTGADPVTYPNEAVRSVLQRTLGVPIFQEQVMQLAVVAAGFTPGEADRLRRAMAAWRRRGDLEAFRRRFIDGMLSRGYDHGFAQRLYRQIQGFGEYGFPESHAASFALLVYVSAWFKRHEPGIFCCALLNSQPMGFYAPGQLIQDARRHDVEVRPVSVNHSAWDCTLERRHDGEPSVRLGLRMVKDLSRMGADCLLDTRPPDGYSSIDELTRRTGLSQSDLRALARADALRELTGHRRRATWRVLGAECDELLGEVVPSFERQPALPAPREGEEIVSDYASLGFTLRRHPIALLRPVLKRYGTRQATEIRGLVAGAETVACGLVINRQRPSTAQGVIFTTLEDETGHVNVVVRTDVSSRQRKTLLGAKLLEVTGVIERDGDVVQLLARHLKDRSALLGRLETRSRDFH